MHRFTASVDWRGLARHAHVTAAVVIVASVGFALGVLASFAWPELASKKPVSIEPVPHEFVEPPKGCDPANCP